MPGKTFVISSADRMMSFCEFSREADVEEEVMQIANWLIHGFTISNFTGVTRMGLLDLGSKVKAPKN